MKKLSLAWVLPILFVGWLFFVMARFFVVQKPFEGANALAFLRVLLDVGTALWLGLIALGLGSWLLGVDALECSSRLGSLGWMHIPFDLLRRSPRRHVEVMRRLFVPSP